VVSGLALQLIDVKLNGRCSILFHLLVAAGVWHTGITQPEGSALELQDVVLPAGPLVLSH
jgi:hypothetical protein